MIFGAATASFQIEGAATEGGRTPSIWDTFCGKPGTIVNADNGDVACDHYHRTAEDVALLRQLGVDSYRFSIAWPRIFPAPGQLNPEGIRFYKDLIAQLKANGIAPAITLYHWDLPQWAQDRGGWENRDCVDWFLEYASQCFAAFGDDVPMWITHNEPWCASFLSHYVGVHAPGQTDLEKALRVAHHILLSHGRAVQAYRKTGLQGNIGITLNLSFAYANSGSFADALAARMSDGYQNRWFLEPLFRAAYPTDMAALFAARCGTDFDFVQDGDLACIAAPCDFLGVNFYSRSLVRFSPVELLLFANAYSDLPKTDMGWDVSPNALGDLIHAVRGYTQLPVYITENGSAWPDVIAADGQVHDAARIDYLLRHLGVIEQLNAAGQNIAGYFAWSLLDNFEWAQGYAKRFGLVYVDYPTQTRTPKDSFYAYQNYIKAHR